MFANAEANQLGLLDNLIELINIHEELRLSSQQHYNDFLYAREKLSDWIHQNINVLVSMISPNMYITLLDLNLHGFQPQK